MPELLSDSWLNAARQILTDLPATGTVNTSVRYTITGAPVGKVVIGVVISGGRVTDLEVGGVTDPDCRVSLGYEVLSRIIDGSLDPDVAFMRGAVKVEGDHAGWLVDLHDLRARAVSALSSIPADGN